MGHCDVCGEKEYNIIPIIPHALVQRTVYADSYITNAATSFCTILGSYRLYIGYNVIMHKLIQLFCYLLATICTSLQGD